jgi:hypothetical protein
MADTGAPWNIPYVTPTDNPRVFPAADEAQALAIAAGLDVAGGLVAVYSALKTDTQSTSLATGAVADVTGLAVTFTPESDDSTFLILWTLNGSFGGPFEEASLGGRVLRDTTVVGGGTPAGNRPSIGSAQRVESASAATQRTTISGMFVDAPATDLSITYKVQIYNTAINTNSMHVNRTAADGNLVGQGRASSSLIVMELR